VTEIIVKNAYKIYEMGDKKIYAVKDVSLRVKQGEFVAIFGPSGSGKTTLLMLLAAIIKPTHGEIFYDKLDITKLSESEAAKWRYENIGFIPQKINLIEFLDVLDNVLAPTYPYVKNFEEVKKRALELIKRVGLSHRIKHKPAQLSVGEQQRVAIARALINNPKVVLADEPTAHLDTETGKRIVMLMKELRDEYNVTFIVSTHDPEIAKIADRIIEIRDGKITREKILSTKS